MRTLSYPKLGGDLSELEALLAKGVDVNARNYSNETIAHDLTREANIAALRLISEHGADFNIESIGGCPLGTAVSFTAGNASESEAIEIIELILNNGAKIDFAERDGTTPLMDAAYCGHPNITKLLLVRGANPHLRNRDGKTAYDIARKKGHLHIARMLKAKMEGKEEADIELYDLHATAASGDMQAVRDFIDVGVDLEVKNDEGKVAFQVAVDAKQYSVAAVLLHAMRDINGKDEQGWTPLNWAILAKDFELMRELIRAGANPNIGRGGSYGGQTAFEVAEDIGIEEELREMLQDEGFKIRS